MATRFYFSSTVIPQGTAPAVTSDWVGGGNHNSLSEVRTLNVAASIGVSGLVNTTRDYDTVSDHLVAGYALSYRFVSAPLAAQTISAISQNISLQIQGSELRGAYNQWVCWKLFLVNAAGVLTNTIVPLRVDGGGTATTPTTAAAELFIGVATANQNRGDSVSAGTPISVALGERLVLEIGTGGLPINSGGIDGHNATLRVGEGPGGTTDLPVNETDTALTTRPWLNFSVDTITFQPATPNAARVTSDTVEGLYDDGTTGTGTLRDTADTIEGLADIGPGATGTLRDSKDTIEGLYDEVQIVFPELRDTSDTVEGLWDSGDPEPPEEEEEVHSCPEGQIKTPHAEAGQIKYAIAEAGSISTPRALAGQVGCG